MRPNTATVQSELQKSINEVSHWCDKNAMILHPAKTKSILLATRQKHQVFEHQHLGIIIDGEFSWRPHITSTCKTISKNLYLLSQLKHLVDTSKQKLFYYAHISPHLTYASTVWDGCSDILFHKPNSLHRKAAKLMCPIYR